MISQQSYDKEHARQLESALDMAVPNFYKIYLL